MWKKFICKCFVLYQKLYTTVYCKCLEYEEDLVRVSQGFRVECRWGRSRPKLTWEQVIRTYMFACGVDGTLDEDRRASRTAIR